MRVTVIGHSCLRLETAAGVILVDPWLSGSCYWRSWWHFPPSIDVDDELLSPDFIYLTHHHFDHFHYPSMRRIDKGAQVLIPKFGVDVMANEVTSVGFGPPRELPHGEVVDLGHGVRVASFQYGFDDTAFVVAEGDEVVVDLNDAKTRGRALKQIAKEFGRPTIACKSYSFAQSYPLLYTADDPADLALITRETYLDDFHDVMADLRPQYALPFGSMVAFLHPDSRHVNEELISPAEVAAYVDSKGGLPDTEVVPVSPGDTWTREGGFVLSDVDWYSDRSAHLDQLAAEYADKLAAQAASEQGRTLAWDDFEAHFGAFVKAVPKLIGRRLVPRPIVFHVPSSSTPYWWIDVPGRRVGHDAEPPPDAADLIHVSEAVLSEAIASRIVQVVHGSMRIRTELRAGGVKSDLAFWGLVMIWELGYLPLRRSVVNRRTWATAARRWREFGDQAGNLVARDPVGKMAGEFGANQ